MSNAPIDLHKGEDGVFGIEPGHDLKPPKSYDEVLRDVLGQAREQLDRELKVTTPFRAWARVRREYES